jgi:hypothetical protein
MKHLKKFNEGFDFSKIEVTNAGPNTNDGGVQIDLVTLLVNGEEYHEFELATTIGGDSYIDYVGGDEGEFSEAFDLVEGERMKSEYSDPKPSDSYLELFDFIASLSSDTNQNVCTVGETIDIDGFEIEVTDFEHNGGYEFGFLDVCINGEEFQLEMKQDATGVGMDATVSYASDRDERIGKKNGINIDDPEMQNFFFTEYDRISNESR